MDITENLEKYEMKLSQKDFPNLNYNFVFEEVSLLG